DLYDFDNDRAGAAMFVPNDDAKLESLFITIELGDGTMGMLVATTRPRDLNQFEDTLIAIANTVVATSTLDEPSNHSSGNKDGNNSRGNDDVELTEELELEDGSFSLNYPDGWQAADVDGNVVMVSDDAVLDAEDRSDIPEGELAVFVYPNVAALGDYPEDIDRKTHASTIVSYYASLAMADGMDQHGAMEELTLGEDEFEASSAYSTLEDEYDQYILTVENGDGDFVTIFAFAAPGELEDFIPTLEAIAATFVTH
ncbi:MAG TPA: hypothetical protein VHL11_10805, partial [Phototrophicaceae bacterium]|nr:hypothetical protein [Phototrophicaceae bacterium]